MSTAEYLVKKSEVKYQKFADGLRQQIQRGELKPGDRLPSLSEMNEQHNLSRTTVERVHRMLERDGLVIREHRRGTFVAEPQKPAAGLIGFCGYAVHKTPRTPYWKQIVEALQDAAARKGHGLILMDHETFTGWDRVDGAILTDPVSVIGERMKNMPARLPRVSILSETLDHPSVVANDHQGGLIAAQHLLELGHRRIAVLIKKDLYPTDRRFAGYRSALKAAGVQFEERWARDYGRDGETDFVACGRRAMCDWLNDDWRELGCTALIVQNDMVAVGVLDALRAAGVAVPDEVSVIGFDNVEICEYVMPRLTTVEVPLREMAETAIELVMRQVDAGPGMAAITVLPVKMVKRDSTAPPPK